jgi:SAM-dependent methyltransferase
MRPEEFSKMRRLEDAHWWFQGRRRLLRGLMEKLDLKDAIILDAGCGTGFARSELSRGGRVIGVDSSPEALAIASEIVGTANCAAHVERLPFQGGVFDLIAALDLLEHLDDDLGALRELHRVCKPGGYLFATVPACRRIWSRHDEALGHRRRYSLRELQEKVGEAGFSIDRSFYTVSAIFPLAVAYRLARRKSAGGSTDLFETPEPLNSLLAGLMKLESAFAWRVSLPFGLTAVVLAYKEEGRGLIRGNADGPA